MDFHTNFDIIWSNGWVEKYSELFLQLHKWYKRFSGLDDFKAAP